MTVKPLASDPSGPEASRTKQDPSGETWSNLSRGEDIDRARTSYTAAELDMVIFPPVRWIVPGTVPPGLVILGGKPKIGKSWFTLGLALSVSDAGRPVLYLSLEDHFLRLQSRLRVLAPGRPLPAALDFHVEWPRLNEGGIDGIDAWLTERPDAAMVAIDTIGKLRPSRAKNEDSYLGDVAVWGALHALAMRHPDVAIVAVHHQRKGEADDPLDTVIGSQGVVGTADTILLLRRARGSQEGTLLVAGRDIEQDLERRMSFTNGVWTDLGPADEQPRGEQEALFNALADGPLTTAELGRALDVRYDAAKKRVRRAVQGGLIEKLPDGRYGREKE